MTTTIDPTSRVKVIDTPIAAPGVCALCGTAGGDGLKFIDFGKQLDWYGAVYFCETCITEVSVALGFIPVATFDKLHDDFRGLQIKFDNLNSENGTVKDALGKLLSGSPCNCGDAVDSSTISPPEPTEFVQASSELFEGNSETNESGNVEGSDDLFDSTDYDEPDSDK